jgi:hypothetical protein
MTLADHIEAYVVALLGLVDGSDMFGAVDALVARDAASRWWAEEAA